MEKPSCSDPGQEDPSSLLSSHSLSVFLPLPPPKAGSAILSAWAVVLKGYYSLNPVSFLKFDINKTDRSLHEPPKSELISVDLQPEWNAVDLQKALDQHIDNSSASERDVCDNSGQRGVWLADEDVSAAECEEKTNDLQRMSEVSLSIDLQRGKKVIPRSLTSSRCLLY